MVKIFEIDFSTFRMIKKEDKIFLARNKYKNPTKFSLYSLPMTTAQVREFYQISHNKSVVSKDELEYDDLTDFFYKVYDFWIDHYTMDTSKIDSIKRNLRCDRCGGFLDDTGSCPRCDLGDEDV